MSNNTKSLFDGTPGSVHKTESTDLKKPLNDQEIISQFGEGMIFNSVDDLEATIADLVRKQPDGRLGKLLNNDRANIFYVRVSGSVTCINVRWRSGSRGWSVSADRVADYWWGAGSRVFRNCGYLSAQAFAG